MTGLIILAAGASNRLGRPKQNLIYQHKTLLQNAIETALQSVCRPVFVILGANSEVIAPNISDAGLYYLHNPGWAEGMASSIRMAIAAIEKESEIDSAVIMVCDQPFVTPGLINTLVSKKQETNKLIIACSYKNTVGVPVLLNKSLFKKLSRLQSNDGAKKIIINHPNDVELVSFDEGETDIDTEADYKRLTGN